MLTACRAEDPRFASPEQAVRTLLASYGLDDVPEQAIRERLAARSSFTLRDESSFRASFADHRGPFDDGAAAYVLGRIAAAKEHLELHEVGTRIEIVTTTPGGRDRLAVLERSEDGYRFRLDESVPREVRARLREIYRRREQELSRRGVRG